jgi:hypothetical protein
MNQRTRESIMSRNGSGISKDVHLPPDPLDRASERLKRANEATDLLAYSEDYEEKTDRHEVNVTLLSNPTATPAPTVPKSEGPVHVRAVVSVWKTFPPWGGVIVALAAIAAYVFLNTR